MLFGAGEGWGREADFSTSLRSGRNDKFVTGPFVLWMQIVRAGVSGGCRLAPRTLFVMMSGAQSGRRRWSVNMENTDESEMAGGNRRRIGFGMRGIFRESSFVLHNASGGCEGCLLDGDG